MSSRIHTYLRTHRRKWALTQKDVAFLLGNKSAAHISRLEQGKRKPTNEAVLACEVLFGLSPKQCFPKVYEEIEESVLARAATLYEDLDQRTGKVALRKKEFLSAALKRAITRINELQGV
ncbi:MAG: helix-turn-helix domain-containing protein [Candidatus Pacebacteria bacterium]|jgi:transcriptional regulator with XRE-family HTH domain|nr:helix-turn-helix domain-containing protein [Candidatus Paceibacterota bacterium]